MQRIPVESTDLVSIGYDEKTRVLEVEFRGNRIYQYRDVEPEVHQYFMKAESHGLFFNSSINGRYRYRRVESSEDQPAPKSVAFATGNRRKFRDLQLACKQFDIEVEQLTLPVDEVQSHDPEEIAVKKAKAAYRLAGNRPVLAQDTYWNILALRGFPGAYMAQMTAWLRAEEFLKLMEGKTDRTVYCKETLAYYDGKRTKVFSRDYQGTISDEPKGKGHFAIDQIVLMAGETKTIAQLEDEEGRSSVDIAESVWHDFAKWYDVQRKLRLV